MPELVGYIAHNFGVRAVSHFAIHFHVGDISQSCVREAVRPAFEPLDRGAALLDALNAFDPEFAALLEEAQAWQTPMQDRELL